MSDLELIIKAIDNARAAKSLTKRAFAASCDITPQYYDLIIAGKSIPSALILFKMAENVGLKLILCIDLQKV